MKILNKDKISTRVLSSESTFAPYVGFGVLMTSKLWTNEILTRYIAALVSWKFQRVDLRWNGVYTKIWEEERGNSKLLGLCHQGIE